MQVETIDFDQCKDVNQALYHFFVKEMTDNVQHKTAIWEAWFVLDDTIFKCGNALTIAVKNQLFQGLTAVEKPFLGFCHHGYVSVNGQLIVKVSFPNFEGDIVHFTLFKI